MSGQGCVLPLMLAKAGGTSSHDVLVQHAVIAGWTGRDRAAVEKHIAELEAVGVRRPDSMPIFYRVSATRLTTNDTIEALGTHSSGEVEFVLLQSGGELWVGVGSDHTDRDVEAYGVTVSKQMCDKPIGSTFWSYEETAAQWDRLVLRSYITEGGEPVLYQEGAVTAMMSPSELISRFVGGGRHLPEGTLMFCGTLAAQGGVRGSDYFRFEIEDPVLQRKIQHTYRVLSLPIMG